jgi:hypothetical protein
VLDRALLDVERLWIAVRGQQAVQAVGAREEDYGLKGPRMGDIGDVGVDFGPCLETVI